MKIWIDADACPVVIKDILFKAAERTKTECTLIANQFISTPKSAFINSIQVSAGFDVADDEIVLRVSENDLVITSDIPLAAEIIEKGAKALSPRGEMYDAGNIKARLNMRDFMETMRSSGEHTRGPAPLNHSDRQQFANQLDKYLTKYR